MLLIVASPVDVAACLVWIRLLPSDPLVSWDDCRTRVPPAMFEVQREMQYAAPGESKVGCHAISHHTHLPSPGNKPSRSS